MDNIVSHEKLFTVIITCWNRLRFVDEALDSVINQTFDRRLYEIILLTNTTNLSIEEKCLHNEIKIVRSEEELQGSFILEAIEQSLGKYVCFLNDDDIFFQNKLEHIYDFIITYGEFTYYHNKPIPFVDGTNANETNILDYDCDKLDPSVIKRIDINAEEDLVKGFFKFFYWAGDSSITVDKRTVLANKIFFKTATVIDQSVFFASFYASNSICYYDDTPLTFWRIHSSDSLTNFKSRKLSTYNENRLKIFNKYLLNVKNIELTFGCRSSIQRLSCIDLYLRILVVTNQNNASEIRLNPSDYLFYAKNTIKTGRKFTSFTLLILALMKNAPILKELSSVLFFVINLILVQSL